MNYIPALIHPQISCFSNLPYHRPRTANSVLVGLASFTLSTNPPCPAPKCHCYNEHRVLWGRSLWASSPADITVVQPPKGHQAAAALLALLVPPQPASSQPQHGQACSFLSKRQGQRILTQLLFPRKRRKCCSFRLGLHYWTDHAQTASQMPRPTSRGWPLSMPVKSLNLPDRVGTWKLPMVGLC